MNAVYLQDLTNKQNRLPNSNIIVRDTIFIGLFPRNNRTTCSDRDRTRDAPETVTQTVFISDSILLGCTIGI